MLLPVGDQNGLSNKVQEGVRLMIAARCVPLGLIVDMPELESVKAIVVPSGDHCGVCDQLL